MSAPSLTNITNGSPLDATPVMSNFNAVANKFNLNIDNSDISPTAGVDGAKLYTGSDNSRKLVNAAIADATILTGKIGVATILQGNMANNSVGTAQIIDSNVTTSKIADLGVTTAKLENSVGAATGVTAAKIATNAVIAGKLKLSTFSGTITVAVQGSTYQDFGSTGISTSAIPLAISFNIGGTIAAGQIPIATLYVISSSTTWGLKISNAGVTAVSSGTVTLNAVAVS